MGPEPDRFAERALEEMPNRLPERMSEYMLEGIAEFMPDRMLEHMPDRTDYIDARFDARVRRTCYWRSYYVRPHVKPCET